MALAESITGILSKNTAGELPAIACDETVGAALVRLSYPNDASYNARVSSDVEAVRKIGKFVLASSEASRSQIGVHVVSLQFSAASK